MLTSLRFSLAILIGIGYLANESCTAFVSKSFVKSTVQKSYTNNILNSSDDDCDTDGYSVNIALTREVEKNDKLKDMIYSHPTTKMLKSTMKVNCIELPCIEHATGPDLESFEQLINDAGKDDTSFSKFDYVVITSPESAKVFSQVVKSDCDIIKKVKIAAVGKATKKVLINLGFEVDFVPSKANGLTLGEELPPVDKVKLNRVIYPASAKADDTIKTTLEQRKDATFTVTRFNTYDTSPVKISDDDMNMAMDDIQVVCLGSPTSVDAWLENVDRILGIEGESDEVKKKAPGCNGNSVAVCIGSTTARRCLESGRWHELDIYYPKTNPGLKGWADCALQAAGDTVERSFWS